MANKKLKQINIKGTTYDLDVATSLKVTDITAVTEATEKNVATAGAVRDFLTEDNLKLAEDLYTYVQIGKAQKASNEVIGSGSNISATNRGKLGSKGDSLKSVFNKVFGEQTDTQPTVDKSSVNLAASAGTTSYGSSTTEVGTSYATTNIDITFTLTNSATSNYGYRCGATKHTGSQTFYYPVTKQNNAHLKITLPSGQTASSSMVTAGTYISHNSNILYCDFNDSKQVTIRISLPAGSVTTSEQTRYGQVKAEVTLGAAQKTNSLAVDSTNVITAFLTYLKNDATETGKLSGGSDSATAGSYVIKAGKYYAYSKLASSASAPTSGGTKEANADADNTYSYAVGQYLWLYSRSSGKKIQTYVAGSWADVTTSGGASVTLTLASGGSATYYAYRTDVFSAAGSARYRLA